MGVILEKTVNQQDLYNYFVNTIGTNGVVTFGAPVLLTTGQYDSNPQVTVNLLI